MGRFLQLSSKNVKSFSNTFTAASVADAGAQTPMILPLILKQNADKDIITPQNLRLFQQIHERNSTVPLSVESKASNKLRRNHHEIVLKVWDRSVSLFLDQYTCVTSQCSNKTRNLHPGLVLLNVFMISVQMLHRNLLRACLNRNPIRRCRECNMLLNPEFMRSEQLTPLNKCSLPPSGSSG